MGRKKMSCFCATECIDGYCPNVQYDAADDKWGAGIADDIGLEKTSCGQCAYNTGRCVDCTFVNTNRCDFAKKVNDKYITPPENVISCLMEISEFKESIDMQDKQEGVGIITAVDGINELKYCNTFKYSGNGDEPWADPDKGYKFGEIRFIDKNGNEDKIEFKHIPGDGLWCVKHNMIKIGDAISWPNTYDDKSIPMAAAQFCTEYFGYKFIVSKELKSIPASVSHSVISTLSSIVQKMNGDDSYIDTKMQRYREAEKKANNQS